MNDYNPESEFPLQSLESGIDSVESRIQDCLVFPYILPHRSHPEHDKTLNKAGVTRRR